MRFDTANIPSSIRIFSSIVVFSSFKIASSVIHQQHQLLHPARYFLLWLTCALPQHALESQEYGPVTMAESAISVDLAGILRGTHGERRRWVGAAWGGDMVRGVPSPAD